MSRINFLPSDTGLLTTGGSDACVMQWNILSKLATLAEESESEEHNEGSINQSVQSDEDDPECNSSHSVAVHHKISTKQKPPVGNFGYYGTQLRNGHRPLPNEARQNDLPKEEEIQEERSIVLSHRNPRQKYQQSYGSYAKQYEQKSRNRLQGGGSKSMGYSGRRYQNNSCRKSMDIEQHSDSNERGWR